MRFFICLLLYTLCVNINYAADDVIVYENPVSEILIGDKVGILKDSIGRLSVSEVQHSSQYILSTSQTPNLGISENTFWVRFSIKNLSQERKLVLELAQPFLDKVILYTPNKEYFDIQTIGDDYVFSNRLYNYPNFIFDLNVGPNETKTFYLQVKSVGQILLPLKLGSSKIIMEGLHNEDMVFGIYCGIMLVMFFYNLFIFITIKDKVYLIYVLHVLFIAFTQSSLLGYPFQYLWPNNTYWANLTVYIFPCCVGVTGIEFLKTFLETRNQIPKLHKFSYLITGLYILTAIVSLFGLLNIGYGMVQGCAVLVAIYMLVVAIVVANKGSKQGRFFLIAWSSMLVGIVIFVLKDLDILPTNIFTSYTMPTGSALETILLSLALADRINILKKEKEASQIEALVALEENRKLITEQNIVLEQKVHERTIELEETNEELTITLTNLKDTQTQLVDAEKMASLGQLTAGIAHEINNPINFVSANVLPLKMDISDVMELLEKYDNLNINSNGELANQLNEIEDFKAKIDIGYLKNEIDILLGGIEDGAKRTAEIVSGLKNFSRLDEGDIKVANLNDGIKSTLILLRSSIPDNIEVVTDLSDIPVIECYPGKLNQVFMNIFNNSIDAMQEKNISKRHVLTVTSYVDAENVCVSIEDTGIGMKPEVKAKIFEPFFTTKQVGSGTGLGMSIVFKIIETHKGKIEIETEYGKGTKIVLILHKKLDLL